ncbi:MAG TPA: efflux RND transporter periplasmic adaptor subunit, partial [candidate division Zixibacteria bacterium]|nr:efflux RND transporter periplasmic adaptor subunit [candidate division Zixibacteria bacterium]
MRRKGIIITALVVLIGAVGAVAVLYGFNGKAGPGDETPRYKEFVVSRGQFRVDVSATGIVQPIDRVEIKSKASGRIEELPIEEGDFVKAGELICRLDKTDVQAELDQARADLDIAEAELKQAENTFRRRKQLFEKGLISEEELDQTELQLAQAKGRMVRATIGFDQAQVRLDETEVRAPIDGVILKKLVEAGQIISSGINNVSGGTAIAALADMQRVYIETGIDEIDVGKVRVGQTAVVVADAFPRRRFAGEIIRVAPEAKVEQNVTQFNVVVQVQNEEGMLKSGMNASVEITIVQEDDALLAPVMALAAPEGRPGNRGVREALVKVDGEFVPREVEIGQADFRNAIIISGLAEGDTLGVVMTSRLKEDNERLEQRIRSTRSFGASGSSG